MTTPEQLAEARERWAQLAYESENYARMGRDDAEE